MEEQESKLDFWGFISQAVQSLVKVFDVLQKYLQLALIELKQDILRPFRYIIFIFIGLLLLLPGMVLVIIALCLYLDSFWHNLTLVCATVGSAILLTGGGVVCFFFHRLSHGLTFLKVTRANLRNPLGSGQG